MKKKSNENKEMRKFKTGATRDTDCGKLDYEGFLSPLVLERYARYMNTHRIQADGNVRASDNWQKGIPQDVYMKSMWRHFMDVWMDYRGHNDCGSLDEKLCALMFNAMGMLHEYLQDTPEMQEEDRRIDEEIEKWQDEQIIKEMTEGLMALAEKDEDEEPKPTIEVYMIPDEKPAKSNIIGMAFSLAIGAIGIGCLVFGLFYLVKGALA